MEHDQVLIPETVEGAVYSPAVKEAIYKIALEHRLHIDQAGDLYDSINLVLLGELKPENFRSDIKNMLELTDEEADSITDDVNKVILGPLIQELREQTERKPSDTIESEDEILNAISEPSPTRSFQIKREVPESRAGDSVVPTGHKIPIKKIESPEINNEDVDSTIEQIPAQVPTDNEKTIDPHEDRLFRESTSLQETTVRGRPTASLIPEDHKVKINSDPYKESVE